MFLSDRCVVMSPPARPLVGDIAVDLPRPRAIQSMDSARFTEISRQVRGHLYTQEPA